VIGSGGLWHTPMLRTPFWTPGSIAPYLTVLALGTHRRWPRILMVGVRRGPERRNALTLASGGTQMVSGLGGGTARRGIGSLRCDLRRIARHRGRLRAGLRLARRIGVAYWSLQDVDNHSVIDVHGHMSSPPTVRAYAFNLSLVGNVDDKLSLTDDRLPGDGAPLENAG